MTSRRNDADDKRNRVAFSPETGLFRFTPVLQADSAIVTVITSAKQALSLTSLRTCAASPEAL
jgi:hypothetical protein